MPNSLLDPGHLTESQVNSFIYLALRLALVKEHIELSKNQHHGEDVLELLYHLKIQVKDAAKKLHTLNERPKPEPDICGDVAEPPGKCFP